MLTINLDWSLQRKGPVDQARHQEKIREAIKENLEEIISDESIITSEGNRTVKVPIRSLKEYRFRFNPYEEQHVGQGNGSSRPGDVLGRRAPKGKGTGGRAGGEPGTDYYEAEITIDELADLIFEDLGLPDLQPKKIQAIPSRAARYKEIRKKGIIPNLDKRRTILENIKRNALAGEPVFKDIRDEDLRFKSWRLEEERNHNAVVVAMRDVSASMGEFKKYITRSFFFWMVKFLRTKYHIVEIVFITHHTQAKEVDEETFFRLGESGGTKVSSAYRLAAEVIEERYNPDHWNIYPFHFSDGDNWGESDNRECLKLVKQLLEMCNIFGYGEINEGGYTSPLMAAFAAIKDERFIPVTITRKKDVYPALKKFFSPREGGVRATGQTL